MNRIVLGGLAALLALVCVKFPIWGIVYVEREFDVYPVVSQETIESMTELTSAYSEFDRACYCYKSGAGAGINGESCEGIANEDALDNAKDHRKAAAAKLDPSLVSAVVLGVNYHTHATWQCSGSSHNPVMITNMGFTPSYDPA